MNMFLASANILGDSLMTGLTLLVVVFAALVALSVVIGVFGKASEGTGSKESAPKVATPVAKPVPAVVPVTASNDEDEVAAVIAAAVAMMAPAGMSYRVRRITPVGRSGHPEWAVAAIRQNTMPF